MLPVFCPRLLSIVLDEATVSEMASALRVLYPKTYSRFAITSPGVLHVEKSPNQIDAGNALESFKINALGPMLLMRHLSPFLPNRGSRPFRGTVQTAFILSVVLLHWISSSLTPFLEA
ncbi:uncharacterized protein BJX67DRAFT_367775 [Aspergillus lucknowensis]|uniref:Uncharacterized protein n=1 Tax=Aspergillus lucknowensis TaxID=176173 RepID=A0ABR4L8P5_9EURO